MAELFQFEKMTAVENEEYVLRVQSLLSTVVTIHSSVFVVMTLLRYHLGNHTRLCLPRQTVDLRGRLGSCWLFSGDHREFGSDGVGHLFTIIQLHLKLGTPIFDGEMLDDWKTWLREDLGDV